MQMNYFCINIECNFNIDNLFTIGALSFKYLLTFILLNLSHTITLGDFFSNRLMFFT